jgi:hypothetical protein
MRSTRLTMKALAGLTVWAGFGLTAQAQLPSITAEAACQVMPVQQGVAITTPTPDQVPLCKVESISNPQNSKDPVGYVVRDPSGRPVRQFVSYDRKNYNIRSFFLNGIEAYREVYPPEPNQPNQFRWLGPNGSKWGLDRDHDGRIDEWWTISPEEVSQELLQAVLTRDVKRAEALVVTKANLDTIGFKGVESQKLLARADGIAKKVIEAADVLKAAPTSRWVQLQLSAPQTTPGDAFGSQQDLVMYKNGILLVKDGENTKSLQIGDLIQIEHTWKLVDGPGSSTADGPTSGGPIPPEIEALIPKLNELDQIDPTGLAPDALRTYNAKRVEILEQVVAKLPSGKQETWLKLLIDALSAAAEGEKTNGKHITRLRQIKDELVKGSNTALAAFTVWRYLIAENNIAIAGATPDGFGTLQEKWRAALEEFARAYPNSEEAPEAMLRLAMAYEYQKDGEPKAKEWYSLLAQKYTKHLHAAKAMGAIKRLESEGKPIELVGPNMANGQSFDIASLHGSVVVVYYCASWSSTLASDAKILQALEKQYGPKGLRIVTVCLDNDAKTASNVIVQNGIPGIHLFSPGGLDGSPLAAGYGILVIPHVIVAGKDGKVLNRNAQIGALEEDLKKLMQ